LFQLDSGSLGGIVEGSLVNLISFRTPARVNVVASGRNTKASKQNRIAARSLAQRSAMPVDKGGVCPGFVNVLSMFDLASPQLTLPCHTLTTTQYLSTRRHQQHNS
jgi:hypothetical protein